MVNDPKPLAAEQLDFQPLATTIVAPSQTSEAFVRVKLLLCCAVVVLFAISASTQTVTVTIKCAKADKEYSIPVGDQPGHMYSISHTTCTYSKPGEIAGATTKEGADTIFTDIRGGRMRWDGTYIETMSNGEKLIYRHHGMGTMKNSAFAGGTDYWEVTRGTGKLAGVRGKGTCKIVPEPDGSATDECTGDYAVPK